jgi:hypothetical protein
MVITREMNIAKRVRQAGQLMAADLTYRPTLIWVTQMCCRRERSTTAHRCWAGQRREGDRDNRPASFQRPDAWICQTIALYAYKAPGGLNVSVE